VETICLDILQTTHYLAAGNDTDIEELLSKSAHLFWKNTAQNGRRVFDYKFDNSYAPPPYYLLPNNSCSG
tara:strand:- start:438 stop:647 length:210 start_codon:yes stop_codon:yes gene_type:complete